MSGIIKAREAARSPHVRPLPAARRASVRDASAGTPAASLEAIEPPLDPTAGVRAELEQARAVLTRKDDEIAELVEALKSAVADGEARGREAALKEAATRREALVDRLRASGERAVDLLERDLLGLERLAVALALESLSKVLGEPGSFGAMAAGIIREQLAGVDAQSVLRVAVSPADFPEAEELSVLAAEIGRPGLSIVADGQLASGDCTIKLTLGTLEVGVNQQWGRLKETLAPLAEPTAQPGAAP